MYTLKHQRTSVHVTHTAKNRSNIDCKKRLDITVSHIFHFVVDSFFK